MPSTIHPDDIASDEESEGATLLARGGGSGRRVRQRVTQSRAPLLRCRCWRTPLRQALSLLIIAPLVVIALVAVADGVEGGRPTHGAVFGHSLRHLVFRPARVGGTAPFGAVGSAQSGELALLQTALATAQSEMRALATPGAAGTGSTSAPLALAPGAPVQVALPADATAAAAGMPAGAVPYVCAEHEGDPCTCDGTIVYGRKFSQLGSSPVASLEEMETLGAVKTIATRHPPAHPGVLCSPSTFGGDPVFGYHGHCYCAPQDHTHVPAVNAPLPAVAAAAPVAEPAVTAAAAPAVSAAASVAPAAPDVPAATAPPPKDIICAVSEGDLCFCNGGTATYGRKFVSGRSGAVTSYAVMTADASKIKRSHVSTFIQCKPEKFGGDPVYGLHGHCYCSGGRPESSDVPRSVIAWGTSGSAATPSAATHHIMPLISATDRPLSPRFASAFPGPERFTQCDYEKAPASSACMFALFTPPPTTAAGAPQCALSRQLLPVLHTAARIPVGVRAPLSVRVFDAAGTLSAITAAATLSVACVIGGEGGTTSVLLPNIGWHFDGSRVVPVAPARHVELNVYRGAGFASVLINNAALAEAPGICSHLDLAVHITAQDGRHLFVERRVELVASPTAVNASAGCDVVVAASGMLLQGATVWGPHKTICAPSGIHVPAGTSLTVLEDVIIIVGVGKAIEVSGAINITATARQPSYISAVDGRPWGWVQVAGPGASATLAHTWLLQGGADSAKSFGHSMPSQPVLMLQRGTTLAMVGGGFIENIGKAMGSVDAALVLDTIIIGHCDTGGQYDDSFVTLRDSHVLEIPDGDGIDADDDNDGFYLHGNNGVNHRGAVHKVSNSVWAVIQDDGIDHNNANVEFESIWILSAHHECIATSGHNGGSVRLMRSVLAGCEQGIEAGYSSNGWPRIVVESSLITMNAVGIRYGDDYQDWGHKIMLDVKLTASVLNTRIPHSPELASTIKALGVRTAQQEVHAVRTTNPTPSGGFDYFHGFRDKGVTTQLEKQTIDACTRQTMGKPNAAVGAPQVEFDATTGACHMTVAPCAGGILAGPPICHVVAAHPIATAPALNAAHGKLPLIGADSFWSILDGGEVVMSELAAVGAKAPQRCYSFGAWLYHLRTATLDRVRNAKPATLYVRPGTEDKWDGTQHCGVSFQADAVSTLMRSSIFVKVAVASPDWHDGEMHVREVLSYFLDRLLGTFVVPPIAGRVVPLANITRAAGGNNAKLIGAGVKCAAIDPAAFARAASAPRRLREKRRRLQGGESSFGAALIQWVPHTSNVPGFSRTHNWAHYVIFQYVGGCMRSEHNYFVATQGGTTHDPLKPDGAKQWWISIDNDRCFTAKSVALASETPVDKKKRWTHWESEVLADCTAVKAVPMVLWRLRRNADSIMEQFPLELEQDELAPLLLRFMRTPFAPPTRCVAFLSMCFYSYPPLFFLSLSLPLSHTRLLSLFTHDSHAVPQRRVAWGRSRRKATTLRCQIGNIQRSYSSSSFDSSGSLSTQRRAAYDEGAQRT